MSVKSIPDDVSLEDFSKNVKIFFMVCERVFQFHQEKELTLRNKVVTKVKGQADPVLKTEFRNMYADYFNDFKSKFENKYLDSKPEVRYSAFANFYDDIDIDLFSNDILPTDWIKEGYCLMMPKPTKDVAKKGGAKPKPIKIYLNGIQGQAKAYEEFYISEKESTVDKTDDKCYIALKFQKALMMVLVTLEVRSEQREKLLEFVKQLDIRIVKRGNEVEQAKKPKEDAGIIGMIKGAISSSGYNFGEGAVDTIVDKFKGNPKLKSLLNKFDGVAKGESPDVSDDLAVDLLEGVGNVINDLKTNMKNGTGNKSINPTQLLDVVGDAFERSEKSNQAKTNNNNNNAPPDNTSQEGETNNTNEVKQ